jgi:hypothetical protein
MIDQRKCGRCGSARTRVIAQSVSPPGDFVQCQDCGHSTLTTSITPAVTAPPGGVDVDKRRIERLVTTVIEAKHLPCRLMAVDKTTGGWRVSMRTQVGDFMKFDVPADSLGAMRAAVERALATPAS